jgi:hypothetical protein
MLTKLYLHAFGAALSAGLFAAEITDRALSELPCYGRAKDKVLDNLFGPAEEFEYIGQTTPT